MSKESSQAYTGSTIIEENRQGSRGAGSQPSRTEVGIKQAVKRQSKHSSGPALLQSAGNPVNSEPLNAKEEI